MLRITRIVAGTRLTLKLEGKLLEAWGDELLRAIAAGPGTRRTTLELRDVSFVDASGAELLRKLNRGGVTLVGCSPFVSEILQLERA